MRVVARLDDELTAWMALAGASLGAPKWWADPVERYGSARALFAATDAELAALGLTPAGIECLRSRDWNHLSRVRRDCERLGIAVVAYSDPAYPPLLRKIRDSPAVLYACGPAPSAAAVPVAVVGSRKPTRYGRTAAFRIAAELAAAGVTVVSGLAYGIDACAHRGALSAGGSAAVLACGLDRPYPRAHRALFESVAASGGALSEYPPGTGARAYRFPARNRIVTGMSRAVVVVEATERSGSLISARLALEQGRELFAVPGNIDSPLSRGTNALLRDGCAPLLDAADVLDTLGLAPVATSNPTPPPALEDPDAQRVLAVLESRPAHVDDVAEACGLDGSRVLELLTALELAGWAERSAGGLVSRTHGTRLAVERGGHRVC